MSLIWNNRDISDGLEVSDWTEHGMRFLAGQGHNRIRLEPVEIACWHWSGGEGDEEQIYRTLVRRKLGIHFFIRIDGRIFQYADPGTTVCAHASAVNDRSAGIEMQNRATVHFWSRRPQREVYRPVLKGKARKLLRFSAAQIDSAVKLARRLPVPAYVPEVGWGGPLQLFTDRIPRDAVPEITGHIGHYHVSRKLDPGTDVLQAIQAGLRTSAPPQAEYHVL